MLIQDTFVVDNKIMIIRILSGVTVEVSVTLELFDTCELVSDHRSMLDWIYLSKIDTLAWVKLSTYYASGLKIHTSGRYLIMFKIMEYQLIVYTYNVLDFRT